MRLKNFAYIDGANLYRGIESLGWKLDYKKFRILLRIKYGVKIAYIFIGYTKKYIVLYDSLREAGFELIFKPTLDRFDGELKGNVDADFVWQLARDDCSKNFERAALVTGDGDFATVIRTLAEENKLRILICPSRKSTSRLLKQQQKAKSRFKLTFLEDVRSKIEYKRRQILP